MTTILSAYRIDDDQRDISVCIAELHDLAERRSDMMRTEISQLEEWIALRESALMLDIEARRDEAGKPVASNEAKRKALLALALDEDTGEHGYQSLVEELADFRREIDEIDRGTERLHGRYQQSLLWIEWKIAALVAISR